MTGSGGNTARHILVLVVFLAALSYLTVQGFTQAPADPAQKSEKWIRIQDDNGEFSVEMPADNAYFYEKNGFYLNNGIKGTQLSEMRIINSYKNDTLLAVDAFKTKNPEIALEVLLDVEGGLGKFDKVAVNGFDLRQVVVKNENYQMVRQYFISPEHVYVLTAAAKKEETDAMRRFLNSVKYPGKTAPEKQRAGEVLTVSFSELQGPFIALETKNAVEGVKLEKLKKNAPGPINATLPSILIPARPRACYTNEARMNHEEGIVEFEITMEPNGGFSKIKVTKALRYGLTWQALMALMRVKFFPYEKDGKTEPQTRKIQYTFTIY